MQNGPQLGGTETKNWEAFSSVKLEMFGGCIRSNECEFTTGVTDAKVSAVVKIGLS